MQLSLLQEIKWPLSDAGTANGKSCIQYACRRWTKPRLLEISIKSAMTENSGLSQESWTVRSLNNHNKLRLINAAILHSHRILSPCPTQAWFLSLPWNCGPAAKSCSMATSLNTGAQPTSEHLRTVFLWKLKPQKTPFPTCCGDKIQTHNQWQQGCGKTGILTYCP